MDDLHYFEKESYLCWIVGYANEDSTSNALVKANELVDKATKFAQAIGIPSKNVNTYFVEKSTRYKYMRVYYAKVNKVSVPKNVFLHPTGEMFDWLKY